MLNASLQCPPLLTETERACFCANRMAAATSWAHLGRTIKSGSLCCCRATFRRNVLNLGSQGNTVGTRRETYDGDRPMVRRSAEAWQGHKSCDVTSKTLLGQGR